MQTSSQLIKQDSWTIFPQHDVTGKSFSSFKQIKHPVSLYKLSSLPNLIGKALVTILEKNANETLQPSLLLYSLIQ